MAAICLSAVACSSADPQASTTTPATETTVASGQRAQRGEAKTPISDTSTTTTVAPTTTTTSSSTTSSTTTTTTEAVIAVGSVDNPVALGSARLVGDWVIAVTSVDEDAESVVLDENPFNDPAAEGEQFVMVGIEATYVGGDTGWPWIEINHWMLGENQLLYMGIETECGVIPGDLSFIGEVFPGGTVSGSLCHRVTADDAGLALLVVEEAFTFDDSDAAVFALHEGVGSVPREAPPTVPAVIDGGPVGSLGNPIELAAPGMVGEWRVSVDSVDLDATSVILAENQFNDTPEPGFSYVLVTVEATYEGIETGDPWFDIRGRVLGESRIAYDGFESYCGVIPNGFTAVGEVEPGVTVLANMCWAVAEDDLGSLLLILEDYQNYDGRRLFYDLG